MMVTVNDGGNAQQVTRGRYGRTNDKEFAS